MSDSRVCPAAQLYSIKGFAILKNMKNHWVSFLLLTLALLTGPSLGWSAMDDLPKLVMCKNQNVARTIRVVKNNEGACETIYTKAGVDRRVGIATHPESCFQFIENIKGNLEEASWRCKEVSKFKVEYPEVSEQ